MPATFGGKLSVIGGQTDANVAYVSTVYEYDPAIAQWIRKADMPTARSAGAAVTMDGRILKDLCCWWASAPRV
jgi:N-acetylneuraminic acid mutarotase